MTDLEEQARDRLVHLRGHFSQPVRVEVIEDLGEGMLLVRVRTQAGRADETTLTRAELEAALSSTPPPAARVSSQELFLWVEAQRIRLAYAHDPYFAVSLSGVRGLPHQIEAVYRRLLPQPRLRFVLADDPGAGKTIMAGLLLKELKLRGVVDRTLVITPAPLTVQWQDELANRFDERFEVVSSSQVRWQLGGNPWQHYSQVITSLDFAKQDDVAPDLLRAEWDMVVVDEAHKCSAVTYGDEVRRTRRYVLVEELSRRAERLLLLTATPHSGSPDRFAHFLALLDPDQFSSVDLVQRQIALPDSPYWLRRQKEDLVDEQGRPLFVRRQVLTQPFSLSDPEMALYQAVTDYIGEYLGGAPGGRGNAIALARTVLQRRLASSLWAIRSSLENRADRLSKQAEQLEQTTPAERRRRLAELRVLDATDEETGTEDADEETEDRAATEVSGAEHIGALRAEVVALQGLVAQADRTIAYGEERKLAALRACLERSELSELADGRGKLLIFTEHRDTLSYLEQHLRDWGYSVCSIHGGHPPAQRKQIQHEFRTERQICVATEAAGEGINLQFCHLMINYDLPWNPVRLEQRMGRIHRIGQTAEVVVINFCATNTIEGLLLERLHDKLAEMRSALQGRVYDVIGDLLQVNGLDFERLMRETLTNPRRLVASLEEISALSPQLLKEYEDFVGIAQATKTVDLSWVREKSWASEERRLMPEYVETFFLAAARRAGLRVEQRADGLYRIEHVPLALRSDDLPAVRRLGRPSLEYRKVTFHKEERERPEHEDAVLCSPGHPLFAALSDGLARELEEAGVPGSTALFVDPSTAEPYRIHLLTYEVIGENLAGDPEAAYAEVVAVMDEGDRGYRLAPPDVLHDLTPAPVSDGPNDGPAVVAAFAPVSEVSPEETRLVTNWVRAGAQAAATKTERESRLSQAELRSVYLREALEAERTHLQERWFSYDEKVYAGEERYRLLRDDTERRLKELDRRKTAKLEGFARLGVVRAGPVTYLGSALVVPPMQPDDPVVRTLRPDPTVEQAAMEMALAYEVSQGRQPTDVSAAHDGSGFDIRSLSKADGGEMEVRRIEVKGRSAGEGDVGLYRTEWLAAQRFRHGYWLYVVYGAATGKERLVTVQDPWGRLQGVEEITQVTGYRVPGVSIEEAGDAAGG